MDMRKYDLSIKRRLLIGGGVITVIGGTILIALIYGLIPAGMALICFGAGLLPVGLIVVFLLIVEWIVRKANSDN